MYLPVNIETNMRWNLDIQSSSNDDIFSNLGNRIDQNILQLLVLETGGQEVWNVNISVMIQGMDGSYNILCEGMKLNITSDKIYIRFVSCRGLESFMAS